MPEATVKCPYVGLRPFEEGDADLFFGRGRESRVISANLQSEPVTILYGSSGVGKSSVLQAGVLPRLRKLHENVAVTYFRSWQDNKEVEALLARIAALSDPTSQKTEFLLLDQFEEFLLYHGENGFGTKVDSALAYLVNRDDLQSKLLIGIREDSLSALDNRLGIRIPGLLLNMLQVEHLDAEAAREAVEKPLDAFRQQTGLQYSIEPQLVDEILQNAQSSAPVSGSAGVGQAKGAASTNQIETVYLQLVLRRLWNEKETQTWHQMRLETLRKIGGADKIVENHVSDVMKSLPSTSDRNIAARLFPHLVTPSGRKVAQETKDLIDWGRAPADKVAAVLQHLSASSDTRILRRLAAPEMYELFHDVLATPVLAWRRRRLLRAKVTIWIISIVATALVAVAITSVFAFQQKKEKQGAIALAQSIAERNQAIQRERIAEDEAQAARARAAGNQSAYDFYQKKVDAANASLRQSQQTIDQLKASNQSLTLTQQIKDLQQKNNTLSAQLSAANTEIANLKNANQSTKQSNQKSLADIPICTPRPSTIPSGSTATITCTCVVSDWEASQGEIVRRTDYSAVLNARNVPNLAIVTVSAFCAASGRITTQINIREATMPSPPTNLQAVPR
jgi:hypothetical protein